MKNEKLIQRDLGFQIKNTVGDKRSSINTENSKSDRRLKSEEEDLTMKLNNCLLNTNRKLSQILEQILKTDFHRN